MLSTRIGAGKPEISIGGGSRLCWVHVTGGGWVRMSCSPGHALCWLDPCLVWQPVAQSCVGGSLGFGGGVSKDWCGRE